MSWFGSLVSMICLAGTIFFVCASVFMLYLMLCSFLGRINDYLTYAHADYWERVLTAERVKYGLFAFWLVLGALYLGVGLTRH